MAKTTVRKTGENKKKANQGSCSLFILRHFRLNPRILSLFNGQMLVFTFCIEFPVFVFSYLQYTKSGGYEVYETKLVWLVG